MDTKQIKVIWSADNIPEQAIYKVIARDDFPRDRVAIKLDRLFFMQHGLNVISEVQTKYRVPVFVDAKIIEVPSKVLGITEQYLKYEPWMLNVMAGACSTWKSPDSLGVKDEKDYDLLYNFAKLCSAAGTLSCAVTVLTSKTQYAVLNEYNCTAESSVIHYSHLMEECGLTDIVCSPQEAAALIRDGCRLDINTPGVRLPGSSKDDQSRINTPHDAITFGAKRIVVGRDIYRKGEPYDNIVPNIERIFADIEGRDEDGE